MIPECLNPRTSRSSRFEYAPPSAAAVREESVALVARLLAARLLAEMEPIDREVLTLRHYEQLPNSDIAEILEIGVTAASNRYVRALRRLKALVIEGQMLDPAMRTAP